MRSTLIVCALFVLVACRPPSQATPTATRTPAPNAAATATTTAAPGAATARLSDLPTCKDAKLDEAATQPLAEFAARSNPPGEAAAYICRGGPGDALAEIRDKMASAGWTKTLDIVSKDKGGVIIWEKDGMSAQAMASVENDRTVLLLGLGVQGADLLPSEGEVGPTHTPRPTSTRKPTATITPRPEGIDAKGVLDAALAKAKEWAGGDVVLLRAESEQRLGEGGGLDNEGKGLAWTFQFARAKPASDDQQSEWFKVTVGLSGVTAFKPFTSMIKVSDHKTIGALADWQVSSAQAFEIAEQAGGSAYRQAQKEPPVVSALLDGACLGACEGSKGWAWEIRYRGSPDQKVFTIDAATGKVITIK